MIIDCTQLEARLGLRAKLVEALGTDDVFGAREDRREDLECITGRNVDETELDAWIIDGELPESK